MATAHCWAGQRDDEELPRFSLPRCVAMDRSAPCIHASFLAADDRVDRRRAASPRFRPVADDLITGRHSYVLTLSVSSESAPCALSETARCPSDDILVHTPFGHTTKGMNQ